MILILQQETLIGQKMMLKVRDLFLKLLDRVFMCDLNTINDIYKCYKDTMYINKNLFLI